MDSSSIDLSLTNIWQSWHNFRQGKRRSEAILLFEYNLEAELFQLWQEINAGDYRHGGYQIFVVTDNKRRVIKVAGVRDRVVHRLLYNYLVPIFDKTFIYDAWSCRRGKGLDGAIKRAQGFLQEYPRAYVWRGAVSKRPALKQAQSRAGYCLLE